jgi:hypothetical protein
VIARQEFAISRQRRRALSPSGDLWKATTVMYVMKRLGIADGGDLWNAMTVMRAMKRLGIAGQ